MVHMCVMLSHRIQGQLRPQTNNVCQAGHMQPARSRVAAFLVIHIFGYKLGRCEYNTIHVIKIKLELKLHVAQQDTFHLSTLSRSFSLSLPLYSFL